jgi:hypothetical protein
VRLPPPRHFGSWPGLSNVQVGSQAKGADRVLPKCVFPCLSRMRRKMHVRFLGEGTAVTQTSYPTDDAQQAGRLTLFSAARKDPKAGCYGAGIAVLSIVVGLRVHPD